VLGLYICPWNAKLYLNLKGNFGNWTGTWPRATHEIGKWGRMKPWILGAAVFAAILACELGLRVCGFGHPLIYKASDAGYELVANQTSTRMGETTHVNTFGLRGPEMLPASAPGMTRILSLGDSVANGGATISDDQTYPAQLQNDLGSKTEVLNASAGGWALGNEHGWLLEHGTFGASVIVLEVNEGDLDEPTHGSDILNHNPSFPKQYPAMAMIQVMTQYVLPRLHIGVPTTDPGAAASVVDAASEARVIPTISEMAQIAKRNDAHFIIVYWDFHAGRLPTQTMETRGKLFAWAKLNSIPVVRPNLSARPDWHRLFRDPFHPNVAGNALIAEAVANQIELMASPSR